MTSTLERIRNVVNVSKSKYERYIERFDNDEEKFVNHFISKRSTAPSVDEIKNVLDNIGINTTMGNLNVRSSNFNVTIQNYLAHVTLELDFENTYNHALEASLLFHCEDSIVTKFSVELNGRKIESVCKTKKEAKEEYDDGVSEGHFVSVQKKLSRDAFSVVLGNIKSSEKGTLTVNYITELANEDRNAVFKMPSIVSQHGRTSTYSGHIDLKMRSEISGIIPETSEPENYTIDLKNKHEAVIDVKTPGKYPIHIEIELEDPKESEFIVEKSKTYDKDALMVSFCPETSLFEDSSVEDSHSEIIFIVDRSGSMSGSRIKQAKDALQIFMRSIPVGTYFDIIGFGSSYSSMFGESVLYDESTLASASEKIETIDSNMGGTDILRPLNHAINLPLKNNLPRQIFLLTDGEDSNPSGILNSVKANMNKSTRIFTFGIGADASKTLVNGIAKFGRGIAEFVNSGDSIESSVIFLLNEAVKGIITDIEIEWNHINREYPNTKVQYPVLFAGERLHTYAIVNGQEGEESPKVILKGKIGTKDVEIECPIHFEKSHHIEGDFIHKAAANMIVNALEDDDAKANKQSIIDIGMKYEISSKYTQFIAVIERENEQAEELAPVNVTVTDNNPRYEERPNISYGSISHLSNQSSLLKSKPMKKKTKSGGGITNYIKSFFASPRDEYQSQHISDADDEDDYSSEDGFSDYSQPQLVFSSQVPSPSPPPPPSYSSHSIESISLQSSYIMEEKKRVAPPSRRKEAKFKSSKNESIPTPSKMSSKRSVPSGSSPLVQLLSMADSFGMYTLDETLAKLIGLSVQKIESSIPSSLKDNKNLWTSVIVFVALELKYSNERSKWKLSGNKTLKYIKDKLKTLGADLEEIKKLASSLF